MDLGSTPGAGSFDIGTIDVCFILVDFSALAGPRWPARSRIGMIKNMNRVALLVSFLASSLIVAQAQDLPPGKGKELVENSCGSCHGLDVVVAQHASKDGWASIVDYMVSRGATGTPEEITTIVDYLAKNFPAAATKTNVNKASSKDLQTQIELTEKDADTIVKYRTDHGDFKDWDGLAKVPGIDMSKLTAKKDSIAFSD
jgi:competence ComEA-like helix-hairpin-helix protein